MAYRLYNQQISPKGYQEGGKVGFFRRTLGKIRKKNCTNFW